MFPVTPEKAMGSMSVADRVKRYRERAQLIRVEVTARTPVEAQVIRHFAASLKRHAPKIAQTEDGDTDRLPKAIASDKGAKSGVLAQDARRALERFGEALNAASPAVIERAERMAETLFEAAARARTAQAVIRLAQLDHE